MSLTLKARVVGGRLMMDEPVELPEGTVVELIPADEVDGLDDAQREILHAALRRAGVQFEAGQGVPSDEALRRIVERGNR